MGRQLAKQYFEELDWTPGATVLQTVGPTVYPLISVPQGWRVIDVHCRVLVAIHASAVIEVGDGDDDNGYIVSGNVTEQTAGIYQGMGAYLSGEATVGRIGRLYTADDTIDLNYTGHASAAATGSVKFVVRMERIF